MKKSLLFKKHYYIVILLIIYLILMKSKTVDLYRDFGFLKVYIKKI